MAHYHLIGIGGTGLSAIARVLLEQGHTVSGSDRDLSPMANALQDQGAQVMLGHLPENINGADWVIRSSAISDDNPEVLAARKRGIPVLKRAEAMERLVDKKQCIAVAGTHGKTTTTGMIAWMLTALKNDPSFIVGSTLENLNTNAHAGRGSYFVIEADEYDRMFLGLNPSLIVITHLEHDHPDCFPTWADYQDAFHQFVHRLKPGGTLLVNGDNPAAAALAKSFPQNGRRSKTFGIDAEADYQARGLAMNDKGGFTFVARKKEGPSGSTPLGQVALRVPGEHNVMNALAGMAVASELGLDTLEAGKALSEYLGSARRFEVRGQALGITLIDDYAHHPTEIRATLSAARGRYHEARLWAIWQPHTYSRTRALSAAFSAAFQDADRVIVTDVYAAREPVENFPIEELVQAMRHPDARHIASLSEVSETLIRELQPGDVVLVLSAGDADQVSQQVLSELQSREKAS